MRYAPTLPKLVDGKDAKRHVVTIIGAGPVGLATALGLANYNIPTLVIEADDSVCSGSRAICVSRRSLEIIERLGALEEFRAKSLPWFGGVSFYGGEEVLRFTMDHADERKHPPMVNLQQYYMEQFLLNAAEKHRDLIEIRWQTRVNAVTSGSKGVELNLQTPQGEYGLSSDWLVACDGARSIVRDQLDVNLQGTNYEVRYVIVDIELHSDRPAQRYAWFDPPSNPGSTILMHQQPDNIWRIDYQLSADESSEEAVKPDNVIARVRRHLAMIGEEGT